MALPLPLLAAGAALLFLLTRKESAYAQAPTDGSAPPQKEPPPPAKTWREMPAALQEQVAAALGQLNVSPVTGEVGEGPISADAIKIGTQTAALCESQGFYEVAQELRRHVQNAARKVPTPPEAKAVQAVAPPGLTELEKEAIARTLTLDRDPKAIRALIVRLKALPASPEQRQFLDMAEALVLQLEAAQSTTQTLQQIDEVIKSPGLPQVQQAVQPLPPAAIPVITPPAPGKPIDQGAPDHLAQHPVTTTSPGVPQKPPAPPPPPAAPVKPPPPPLPPQPPAGLKLDQFPDPAPKAKLLATQARINANVASGRWKAGQAVSKGAEVKSAQTILKGLGFGALLGTGGANKDGIDSDYGGKTESAVKALQQWGLSRYQDPRITVDGIFGPITRRLVLMRTAEAKAAQQNA